MRQAIALFILVMLGAAGCTRPPVPPSPPPVPAAGWWFDTWRESRVRQAAPELLAGAAAVRITPPVGVVIAGHGFNKHARGVLDDLWARALVLDDGAEVVALVSLDVIGLALPRVERIRARLTREHPERILVFATHNHDGPDTLGFWGPAVLRLLPVRSGQDPAYMDWLEARAALAVRRALGRLRPARLGLGSFELPRGLAVNLREPEDVERRVQLVHLEAPDGSTIATLVHWGCHAESLQDENRLLSADFPGVLYRELETALGGVALFVSGPAGGMVEPADEPSDPEPLRLAFRERLGGALAAGTITRVLSGLQEPPRPRLSVSTARLRLPLQTGGLVGLAIDLGLLDSRPLVDGALPTELTLVTLGPLQLLAVPGEPTPELGRELAAALTGEVRLVTGLGNDELGYFLSDRQWNDARFDYERSMSVGPEAARLLLEAARELAAQDGRQGD